MCRKCKFKFHLFIQESPWSFCPPNMCGKHQGLERKDGISLDTPYFSLPSFPLPLLLFLPFLFLFLSLLHDTAFSSSFFLLEEVGVERKVHKCTIQMFCIQELRKEVTWELPLVGPGNHCGWEMAKQYFRAWREVKGEWRQHSRQYTWKHSV